MQPDIHAPDFDALADEEELARPKAKRPRGRKAKAAAREQARQRRPKTSRRRSRIGVVAILIFAVAVFGWAAYVFLPHLFGSGSTTADGTAATTANTNPAAANPAVATGNSIIVFQGGDPTVFEAGADNPVHYQGDTAGGHVQITSSATSGGARAVLGPGVANRLVGHQVRFVIEARATPGQPAQAVRFIYVRGLSTLAPRLSPLLADFGVITPTWDIPAGTVDGNDYLLIEPGVPGDGTAVDIRSIRIEILD